MIMHDEDCTWDNENKDTRNEELLEWENHQQLERLKKQVTGRIEQEPEVNELNKSC